MEEENKTAPKKNPLDVVKGFGGILPNKVIFATPPAYKEAYPNQPDKWPVFKIKPSDGLDFNQSIDRDDWYKSENGGIAPIPGKIRTDKLRFGVKGWKNFKDGEEEIPFLADAEGNLTEEGVRALLPDLQGWLLGLITGAESISKEESDGLKF